MDILIIIDATGKKTIAKLFGTDATLENSYLILSLLKENIAKQLPKKTVQALIESQKPHEYTGALKKMVNQKVNLN